MASSKQIERLLREAKYRELKDDYQSIMSMVDMTKKINSEQHKTPILMELIQQLGENVCSIHYNSYHTKEEIDEIIPLKENVQAMMRNYTEWPRGWQSVWGRIEDIRHQ